MEKNIMWTKKYFKTLAEFRKWIEKNSHKYQIDIIFVNNGMAVEYRPLRRVY